jgi:plastocyanin
MVWHRFRRTEPVPRVATHRRGSTRTGSTSLRTAAALGVLIAVAACGGGDDDTDATIDTATAQTVDDPTDGTATPAGDATITIADFAFEGVTEVAVGTTVVVTNTDGASHTWTAVDGSFDSGALGQGDSFEFTFTEPGEFEYACNFHPSMQGTIVVTA